MVLRWPLVSASWKARRGQSRSGGVTASALCTGMGPEAETLAVWGFSGLAETLLGPTVMSAANQEGQDMESGIQTGPSPPSTPQAHLTLSFLNEELGNAVVLQQTPTNPSKK